MRAVPKTPLRGGRSLAAAAGVLLPLALAAPASAMETDPYLPLEVELRDSATSINRYVNDKLRARVARVNRRSGGERLSCEQVAGRALRGFRKPLHSRIALWVHRQPGIDRFPRRGTGNRAYYRRSILGEPYYANLGIPLGRSVNVGGIYFSVDKLGHFFSFGQRYHRRFRSARRRGADEEQATREAILWGLGRERRLEGKLTTGIISFGDLEANYQGFRLARSLCSDDGPARLRRDAQGDWVLEGEVDLRDYVNPDWDEAYNPSFYVQRRWKHIRDRVLSHCSKLASPEVRERFERYDAVYRESANARLLRELERRGELPSREAFSLRAVCEDAGDASLTED